MQRTFDVVALTLGSVVANGGAFTVGYPAGRDSGAYTGGYDHQAATNTMGLLKATDGDISVSFGASSITITNNSGSALPAGTEVWVQLDRVGDDEVTGGVAAPGKMSDLQLVMVNLGAPDVADPNGYVESQNLTSAGVFSSSGTAAAALAAAALGGVADVPRNVVAAWTTTAVLTVTGTDEYGNVIVESSASGTSMAGKKAFKTITDISVSANVTGLTVGTGDVLGLPAFLPSTGHVLKELQDGAAATAGTVVAGVSTAPATATTGDVRGTYDPNAACDGAKSFQLAVLFGDPSYKGVAQYAG